MSRGNIFKSQIDKCREQPYFVQSLTTDFNYLSTSDKIVPPIIPRNKNEIEANIITKPVKVSQLILNIPNISNQSLKVFETKTNSINVLMEQLKIEALKPIISLNQYFSRQSFIMDLTKKIKILNTSRKADFDVAFSEVSGTETNKSASVALVSGEFLGESAQTNTLKSITESTDYEVSRLNTIINQNRDTIAERDFEIKFTSLPLSTQKVIALKVFKSTNDTALEDKVRKINLTTNADKPAITKMLILYMKDSLDLAYENLSFETYVIGMEALIDDPKMNSEEFKDGFDNLYQNSTDSQVNKPSVALDPKGKNVSLNLQEEIVGGDEGQTLTNNEPEIEPAIKG
jgi:hypothetical protein